jgi:hypothetical protein
MDAFKALAMIRTEQRPIPSPVVHVPAPQAPIATTTSEVRDLVLRPVPVPLASTANLFEQPRIKEVIISRLKLGYPAKVILQACGITAGQWRTWMHKGQRGIEPFASFVNDVGVAQAEGAVALLDQVRAAGEGAPDQHGIWKNQWQASKWLLERQDPDTFMPVEKSIQARIDLPAASTLDVRGMSDADLEQLLEIADRAPVVVSVEEEKT